MNLITLGKRASGALAIAVLGLGCPLATAHDAGQGAVHVDAAARQDGTSISLAGRLSILDVVVPMGPGSERIYALAAADGTVTRIEPGVQGAAWTDGMALALSGHMANSTLIVDQFSTSVPASALPPNAARGSAPTTIEGTVKLRHADYFDAASSQFFWAIESDDGQRTELNFAIAPKVLKVGMRIQVTGHLLSAGLMPESMTVQSLAPSPKKPAGQTVQTDNVLVILIRFSDSPAGNPFTQAQVQATMGAANGVAAYWQEASFGQEVMVPTVTAWLQDSKATTKTCDYGFISSEAQALAVAAGYQHSQYQFQKYVYLFPSNSSCGWAGLGDVGGPDAWSNGYNALWVIGHELGHTIGHGHDNALVSCNGVVIGPKCVNSQYGDPWGIMGNQRTMHANVWQKNNLGWITSAQVATHTQGVAAYTLSPLESPGGGTYGVAVLANAHRSYWVEFRQAVGFDAGLSGFPTATDGAIVHLANVYADGISTDYSCWDTCFLDMTPLTSPTTDGALAVGSAFTDNDTGVTITAISKGAGGLTVSVAAPTRPTFVDVPLAYWANAAIEALVWNGITKGCASSPRQFCPTEQVTREQLAVFVERSHNGWMFSYAATGVFADVLVSDPLAGFVESVYKDGIMTSCNTSPLDFCPTTLVTRAAMAEILMKGRNGATWVPPAATGLFADVPKSDPNAPWIEALYNAGITLGCASSPLRYCPNTIVSRDQMAVFLQRAFYLQAPPP
jgi:hypothetical protein